MRFSAAKVNPNLRNAYIATDKNITTELNKMLDKKLTPLTTKIFSVLSDAEIWVKS